MKSEMQVMGDVEQALNELSSSEARRRVVRYFMDKYNITAPGAGGSKETGLGDLQGFGEAHEKDDLIIEHEGIFGKERINVSAGERAARKQTGI
jgi:hypothetical protein